METTIQFYYNEMMRYRAQRDALLAAIKAVWYVIEDPTETRSYNESYKGALAELKRAVKEAENGD